MSIETMIQREVKTVESDASCREAAAFMRDTNIGCVVVVGADAVPIGIVTDRDLTVRVVAEGGSAEQPVREVMSANPIFVSQSAPIDEVITTMRQLRVRRMIVVDDERSMCGILSMDDIVMYVGDTLAGLAEVVRSEVRG